MLLSVMNDDAFDYYGSHLLPKLEAGSTGMKLLQLLLQLWSVCGVFGITIVATTM